MLNSSNQWSKDMAYSVKEIYYTLQGEGLHAGRAAVFCRFSGCNLWSGREHDRARASCRFCDTDFVGRDGPGGGLFTDARALAEAIAGTWRRHARGGIPFVVCTGGEPLLQMVEALIQALHRFGLEIAVETNGTRKVPSGVDHICVSPKGTNPLEQRRGDELKLVYPQEDVSPEAFEELDFRAFFLQPMDGPHRDQNTLKCVNYCQRHPQWRLSVQVHKLIGIP